MSIVLVAFPGAPKPQPEAVEREKRIEEYIERRTRGSFSPKPSARNDQMTLELFD